MKDQFKRILNLVRKTGDTLIVTDPNGENSYVVMDLNQYERLLDKRFESDELDESDDEDPLGEWTRNRPSPVDTTELPNLWDVMQPAGETGGTWNVSEMSENELKNLEEQYQAYAAQSVAEAIEEVAAIPHKEDDVAKIPQKEEDFGEEQFYLEPIE